MNELVIIGKTVSTFGIKGELKVISDFEKIDSAFLVNKKIIINNIEHTITSVRKHKNYILLGIDNLDNINLVLEYVGYNVYIKKLDLNLKEDEYLYSDLIDAQVIDDDGSNLGKIIEVVGGSSSDLIKIKGEYEFLLPINTPYVKLFDKSKKILYTENARSLII